MTTGRGYFIAGQWVTGIGPALASHDPATGEMVWEGRSATAEEVDQAVMAARAAAEQWASRPVEQRVAVLQAFAAQLKKHTDDLARTISLETGKPLWESRSEVAAMVNKIPLSIEAYEQRTAANPLDVEGAAGMTRYKPHGVVAVFGPFNFPGHLPNGHIVPALLAGNTVVFKPSELTPGVAEKTVELWEAAGLLVGVLNLVQGGPETGAALASHAQIDGIFFTGSAAVGQELLRQSADQPQKILALEMGGNNPLVVWDVGDLESAAYLTIQSAYITAGQRCSCARRLIVPGGNFGDDLMAALVKMIGRIHVGPFTAQPEPFMGPVISPRAAEKLLANQAELVRRGGRMIVPMVRQDGEGAFLSPGLIDVTEIQDRPDREMFGPILQVVRVADFDAAIAEANRTAYGLVAGLLSDRADLYEAFYRRVRAGLINWNRQTTNASSRLPFGGVGLSGNHRPSGSAAVDYCAYPVASLEIGRVQMPAKLSPGIAP